VLNDLDRFYPSTDAMGRMPQTGEKDIYLKQQLKDKLIERRQYFDEHCADLSCLGLGIGSGIVRNRTKGNHSRRGGASLTSPDVP
jgi:hypothetical protein